MSEWDALHIPQAVRLRRHPSSGFDRFHSHGMRLLTTPQTSSEQEYPDTIEAFIEEVLGVQLTAQGRAICHSIQTHRRTAVKSCHASSKTFTAAAIVVAFLHVYPMSKVVTTGPGGTQVATGLWQYIRDFHRQARIPLRGKPSKTRWEILPNWFALGYSPAKEKAANIHGYHAPKMLVVVDEASDVEQVILLALDSLLTSETAHLLLLGNPTRVNGILWDAFTKDASLWHRLTISAFDTPNILAGETVVPGLIDQTYVDDIIAKHGKDSDEYRVRVLGEFPIRAGSAYVPLEWITRAEHDRLGPVWQAPLNVGIDVARSGDDRMAMAAHQGPYCYPVQIWQDPDLMGSVQQVLRHVKELRELVAGLHKKYDGGPPPSSWGEDGLPPVDQVNVDTGGIGAGLTDRLEENRRDGRFPVRKVNGINFGGRARDPDFVNAVDEMWWGLRDCFHLGHIRGSIHPELIEDLTSRRTVPASAHAGLHLEPKEAYKKRMKRSPDVGDAYALAFYRPDGAASTALATGVEADRARYPRRDPLAGAYAELDDADWDEDGGTVWPT